MVVIPVVPILTWAIDELTKIQGDVFNNHELIFYLRALNPR